MPYTIQPEDRIHVDEFRQRPMGPHSPGLLRVLNRMRGGPMAGRYILVCTRPFAEWRLALHPGDRAKPIQMIDGYVFTSREEAEWAVFRMRWRALTGDDLN